MPKIVDREQMQNKILLAYESCVQNKHISQITLRDIAAKAQMTHPALLNYFSSKEEIFSAYCDYTRRYTAEQCVHWFAGHDPSKYPSPLAYMNAFLQYMVEEYPNQSRPQATIQTCIMAKYDQDTQKVIAEEFSFWRETLETCIKEVYGERVGEEEAEALIILIAGLFVCNYSGALTGKINANILSPLFNLK